MPQPPHSSGEQAVGPLHYHHHSDALGFHTFIPAATEVSSSSSSNSDFSLVHARSLFQTSGDADAYNVTQLLGDCLLSCLQNASIVVPSGSDCVETCIVNDGYAILPINSTTTNCTSSSGGGIPIAVSIVVSAVLICFSALFSGLTLGLLSLDLVALKVLESAGDEKEKEYAKKIIPVRTNGNLLLCTLLLGNTIVNNGVSILLADLTSGVIGLVISVTLVLICGEILPQAVCSRHALFIGAHTIWLVKIFRICFLPITYPLSLGLNWLLGRDIGNVYSLEEIKRLLELHATDPHAKAESGLNEDDHQLLMGALEYKTKKVKDVMTSLDQCYMLEISQRLDFSTMLSIYKSGFTRIPVYSGTRQNIVGVMYAKDLILVDPDDEIELTTILSFRGRHGGHVMDDTKLDKALRKFLASGTHLMIVHKRTSILSIVESPKKAMNGESDLENVDVKAVKFALEPSMQSMGCAPGEEEEGEVIGIITLEDVMEELIKTEIVDESDQWEDVEARVPRRIARKNDIDGFLRMFERKASFKGLETAEVAAVAAFLALNVEEFALIGRNDVAMKSLIRAGTLIERSEPSTRTGDVSTPGSSTPQSPVSDLASRSSTVWASENSFTRAMDDNELQLYHRGQRCSHFILILQGRVEVHTSSEGFSFDLGPWSVLGNRSLSQETYIPDFDAHAVPPCRLLKIEKSAYMAALRASNFSVIVGGRTLRNEIHDAARSVTREEARRDDSPGPMLETRSSRFGRQGQN